MEIDLRGSRRSGGQRLHVLFALFDWTRAWAFQDCRSRIHSVKQRGDGAGFAEPRASHYIALCARERLPCRTSSIPPRVRFLYDPNASATHSPIGNHGRIEGKPKSAFPPGKSGEKSEHFTAVLSAEKNPVHEDDRRKCRGEGPKESIEANQNGRSEMEHGPGKKQRYQYARGSYEGYGKNDLHDDN